MSTSAKWVSITAVALALLCLLGYLTVERYNLNTKALVVIFWLAFICSLITLFFIRPKQVRPLLASIAAWALLWPASETMLAWSAWWFNGFGP
jgi:FtsH-binding integral membrane protein